MHPKDVYFSLFYYFLNAPNVRLQYGQMRADQANQSAPPLCLNTQQMLMSHVLMLLQHISEAN